MNVLLSWIAMFAAGAGTQALPASPHRAAFMAVSGDHEITLVATPGAIHFHATNPDAPGVPGQSPVFVTWQASGTKNNVWSLSLQASSSTFENCPGIPASAVTVSCMQTSVTGGSSACSPSFPLSTGPQVVAAGGQSETAATYQVSLQFTLADSWKYAAKPSCSLSVTYTANLP